MFFALRDECAGIDGEVDGLNQRAAEGTLFFGWIGLRNGEGRVAASGGWRGGGSMFARSFVGQAAKYRTALVSRYAE